MRDLRPMTGGDLQELRELLGLGYNEMRYLVGLTTLPTKSRGEEATQPIEKKGTALLVRLLLTYPQFSFIPLFPEPREVIVNVQTLRPKQQGNRERLREIMALVRDKSLVEIAPEDLRERCLEAFRRMRKVLKTELAKSKAASIPMKPLSEDEGARAHLLYHGLFSTKVKENIPQIHLGRFAIIAGQTTQCGYAWMRDDPVAAIPTAKRLFSILEAMIQELGMEGLYRYLLVVDTDAYADGHPDGLLTLFALSKQ